MATIFVADDDFINRNALSTRENDVFRIRNAYLVKRRKTNNEIRDTN